MSVYTDGTNTYNRNVDDHVHVRKCCSMLDVESTLPRWRPESGGRLHAELQEVAPAGPVLNCWPCSHGYISILDSHMIYDMILMPVQATSVCHVATDVLVLSVHGPAHLDSTALLGRSDKVLDLDSHRILKDSGKVKVDLFFLANLAFPQ